MSRTLTAWQALAETQRGLAAASATLRDKVEATRSEEARRAPLFSGCVENAQQFVVHADALVASFEQELVLRRAVAGELRYGAVDEQRAALYLSAWVLQPYVDLERLELLLVAVAAEADPQTALLQSPMRSPAARSPGKPR